ncbi:acyltransferase family protein [Edwardsiella anguillarum]|nr:acyltransferase family protein [Edwardsiella anguillarum]
MLFVITSHYSYMFDTSTVLTFPREYLTAGIGRLGVSFFFMISGALAYLSLRKYAAHEYYLRRVYSVLIPYNIAYFGMALLLLALGCSLPIPAIRWSRLAPTAPARCWICCPRCSASTTICTAFMKLRRCTLPESGLSAASSCCMSFHR